MKKIILFSVFSAFFATSTVPAFTNPFRYINASTIIGSDVLALGTIITAAGCYTYYKAKQNKKIILLKKAGIELVAITPEQLRRLAKTLLVIGVPTSIVGYLILDSGLPQR